MKKLTYLFLALLIVACGSDDSSEQQNFLQKYNGVTWADEEVLIEGDIVFWIVFSPDGLSDGEAFNDGNIYCGTNMFPWGVYGGYGYEIIENSSDRLRIEYFDGEDGNSLNNATYTYTVSNNGIILNEESIYSDGEYTKTYTRNNSLPCPE